MYDAQHTGFELFTKSQLRATTLLLEVRQRGPVTSRDTGER